MKFLNINDTKLKVTLTARDLIEYRIDITVSDYSTKEIREAIRAILEVAKSECGFSVSGEKILVQLYPLPGGECEILVTKLGAVSKKDRAVLSSSESVSVMEHRRGTYRFDTLVELRLAVRGAYRKDAPSDLYRDDLGRYYLHIDEEFTDGISEYEIFVEYGERLNSLPIAVLSEYGTLLAKDTPLAHILSDDFFE